MTVNWDILSDPVMIARLILQVFLFMGSALFSMSETALFSLRETDLHKLDARNGAQSARIRNLLDEPRQLIVSILCGNELINIAATINLAGILLALFGDPQTAGLVNTAVMLPLLLLLGEITPKTLAVTQPATMATKVIEPVITRWVRIVMPLRAVVRLIADWVTTMIVGQARNEQNILSTDEFRTLLEDVEDEGVVNAAERRIILNLIEAGSTPVTQIMVPRPQVVFADYRMSVVEIADLFRRKRHRRIPVFRDRHDEIIGVIKVERLMERLETQSADQIDIDDLIDPAVLIPETKRIGEIEDLFRNNDEHAALVVSEFGGIEGLVSVDDVFEFITMGTGAYLDAEANIRDLGNGAFRCSGLAPLRLFRRELSLSSDVTEGVSTVGGYFMMLKGAVPKEDDAVEENGMVLRVVRMKGLLVKDILIAPKGHAALEPPGQDDAPQDVTEAAQ